MQNTGMQDVLAIAIETDFMLRLSLLCAALLMSGVHAVLAETPPPVKKPPVKVKAVTVQRTQFASVVTGVGSLIANESIMLRPEVAGRITAFHFKEGQHVARGALLVSLDAQEPQAQVMGSDAEVNLAKQRYERAQELFKKNFISQQALDDSRDNLTQAQARREQSRARLAKTQLRAPFAGTLGLRQVSLGAVIQAGQDIVRLEDTNPLKLDFRVSESQLSKIRIGQHLDVKVDAFPDKTFGGSVYAIEPAVDEKSRSLLLRARVPNPAGNLRPGMFARVVLRVGGDADALVIPEQAVIPKGDKAFVYRVVQNKAQLTPVVLGARRPGEVAVVSGLRAGELVVTEGHQKLSQDAAVSVLH